MSELQIPDTALSSESVVPESDEVILRCVGLTKVFRDFWMRNRVRAVDGIDLDIRRGEVFGLLGPNGSGKSTTIKMLLGLLAPTSGRISVFGKRPEDVATKNKIGYLPEESHLYRFLNARETLDYYARLFHQNRVQRKRRIDELLHMVGLEAVERRPVGEYSKGMQRRIGIAQALINDPQLLILDEPTSGLDPLGTRQIKDLILSLRDRGKTILLSSHLLSDVEDVCARVSIMFGGKVRRHGTVDELLVEDGATLIRAHGVNQTMIDAVDKVLAEHGSHIDKVEYPRQKLETLFLDIVKRAQSEGVATSGARSDRGIAAFLQDAADGAGTASQGDAIIDSLVNTDTKPSIKSDTAKQDKTSEVKSYTKPGKKSGSESGTPPESQPGTQSVAKPPASESDPVISALTAASDIPTSPTQKTDPLSATTTAGEAQGKVTEEENSEEVDADVIDALLDPKEEGPKS